jgi:hypothetical protein
VSVKVPLLAVVVLLKTLAAAAQVASSAGQGPQPRDVTVITPSKLQAIVVTLPTSDRPAGAVQYALHPAQGVQVLDAREGTLMWDPGKTRGLQLRVGVVVSDQYVAGRHVIARVALRWPNGVTDTVDIAVEVRAETSTASASTKEIEAELISVQRAAPPGGAVRLRFSVVNLEETDQQVRLRVVAGPGWTVLNPEFTERDWLIERFNWIQGEIDLGVPDEAQVGDRELVRLLVQLVGEPGEIEARNYVSVAKGGGIKPGVATASGSVTAGLSQLGIAGLGSTRQVRAVVLSSKFGPDSNFSLSIDQGLQENLSNFRYEEARTRVSGSLRYGGWMVNFGNLVSAPGNALSGPFVLGLGARVQRPAGRLLTELTVAKPNTITAVAGGHLVRGRVGLRTPKFTVAAAASIFSRPTGGYTAISNVQTSVLDPSTQEEVDFERRLTSSRASNRVHGLGVDTEFRPARAHHITFRVGGLWLSNASGDNVGAVVGEASYRVNSKRAAFNMRWRGMPPTVTGIFIPGDEVAADGSFLMGRNVRLVAGGYRNSTGTFGRILSAQTEGASVGLRFTHRATRLEVRGNYRESLYSDTTVRRTISFIAGTPVGPLTVTASADLGTQESRARQNHVGLYRSDVRWTGKPGMVSFTASLLQTAGVRQQRIDLLGSLKLAGFELAGGAWATSGYTSGGRPGVWTSVGVPVGWESMLLLGVDYSPPTWTSTPSLRGIVSIRKMFTLPLPFMHSLPPAGIRQGNSTAAPVGGR